MTFANKLHGVVSLLTTQQVFSESRNSPPLMEPENLLLHSQVPATYSHREPYQSSPCFLIPHFKIHFNITLDLCVGLPSHFLPSGLPTKTLYAPPLLPYVQHAQPFSFLISSPK